MTQSKALALLIQFGSSIRSTLLFSPSKIKTMEHKTVLLNYSAKVKREDATWNDEEDEKRKLYQDDKAGKLQEINVSRNETEQRRIRTRFTIYQKAELEAVFISTPYISPQRRTLLADRLRVSPIAIQSWFKNRRFKWRKEMKDGSQPLTLGPPYLPHSHEPISCYSSERPPKIPVHCQGCYRRRPTTQFYPYTRFAVYGYPPYSV